MTPLAIAFTPNYFVQAATTLKSLLDASTGDFDVICMKEGCAYNFQCKNNYLDINTICPDNIGWVCRQNKRLEKYYLRALDKENFRTKLVKEHFGVDHVENYVVARFPVVSKHDRIIPYNKLEGWLDRLASK